MQEYTINRSFGDVFRGNSRTSCTRFGMSLALKSGLGRHRRCRWWEGSLLQQHSFFFVWLQTIHIAEQVSLFLFRFQHILLQKRGEHWPIARRLSNARLRMPQFISQPKARQPQTESLRRRPRLLLPCTRTN